MRDAAMQLSKDETLSVGLMPCTRFYTVNANISVWTREAKFKGG